MYTTYMTDGLAIITSWIEGKNEILRIAKVANTEDYVAAIKQWYPDDYARMRHFTVFYYPQLIDAVKESIQATCIADGIYSVPSSTHYLFDHVQNMFTTKFNELEADDDFVDVLTKHIPADHCSFNMQSIDAPKDTTDVAPTVTCKTFLTDPWSDYPIVWSPNAIKDLIVRAKLYNLWSTYNLHQRYDAIVNSVEDDMWSIDPFLNLRSKEASFALTPQRLAHLQRHIGSLDFKIDDSVLLSLQEMTSFAPSSNVDTNKDTSKSFMPFEPFDPYEYTFERVAPPPVTPPPCFTVINFYNRITHQIGCIIKDPSLPELTEIEALYEYSFPSQYEANVLICQLSALLEQMKTKEPLWRAAAASAQKLFNLASAPVAKPKRAYILYKHPIQHETLSIVQYLHSLGIDMQPNSCVEALFPAWVTHLPSICLADTGDHIVGLDGCVRFFEKESGVHDIVRKANDFKKENPTYRIHDRKNNQVPAENTPLTTRKVLEHLIHMHALHSETEWCRSSEIIDLLSTFIIDLQAKSSKLNTLCHQKNQLSIILSDIVPKKRFITGQMFRMRKPTPKEVNEAIQSLLEMIH